ncbi:endoglucanase A-like [Dreissena polymorpha]|uniref:Endoglucanase n=1 Tax=Dreissena polymorpha TaxID=45954 RepID=A0A9D3YWV0_DREPO|nr:endoglucanase A-like [Dreissena polymorpha]KAH3706257.1 hypothetical protein DPMN_065642 [Dreissena polymorpha]
MGTLGYIGLAMCVFVFGRAFCSVPIEQGSSPWQTSYAGKDGYLRIQYYCTFIAPDVGFVDPGKATVSVTFDRSVHNIENWDMSILSPSSTNRPANVFQLTNLYRKDFSNFPWSFHGIWKGSITSWGPPVLTSPPVPKGTCTLMAGNGPVTTTSTPVTTKVPTVVTLTSTLPPPTPASSTTATTSGNQPMTTVPTIDQTPDLCKTYTKVQTFQLKVDAKTYPYNYVEVLCKSILFYEAQRSGRLPANQRVTWRKDSALNDGQWGSINRDLTGGWYDAGDLVKYGLPMASSTTVLLWGFLQYRGAYDMAGQTEYMYDSVRWALNYFLKLWDGQNNRFYAQVGDGRIDHNVFERPEDMTSERPVYYNGVNTPGSDVAAETASALAIGYLVFKDRDATYANQLLNTAKNIYDFAYNYRGLYSNYIADAARTYGSGGYEDELTQAGVWLYRATGIHSYLTQAESFTRNDWAWSYSWDLKEVAANILLYNVTTDSNKKATYGNHVRNFLRRWSPTGNVPYTPGGLVYRDQWGSLRYAANAAFAALLAQDLGIISQGDTDSRTALDPAAQLHYILGNNPVGLSYVVGFGRNYPKRPHHKSSFCAPAPAPQCTFTQFNSFAPHYYLLYGAMVGGPDSADQYDDSRINYQRSEVACDYNAGLQSALAGLINRKVLRP